MLQSHAQVSLQKHPQLLGLLSDEMFRQELKARPLEVLARFGAHLQAREVPLEVELPAAPSKVTIAHMGLI